MLNLAGSTCEYAEDAGAASDIEDDFVLEEFWVEGDCAHVGLGPDGVFEHFFVNGEVGIAIEVVVIIFDVAHEGSAGFFLLLLFHGKIKDAFNFAHFISACLSNHHFSKLLSSHSPTFV